MFIRKLKNAFYCLVLLGLLLSTVGAASARGASVGISRLSPNSFRINDLQTGDLITFSQVLTEDIFLNGPLESESLYFSLPANWRLIPGAQLNISMSVAYNTNTQAETFQGAAGNLTVTLNDVLVGVMQIETAGEVNVQFEIPPAALATIEDDGLYQLQFLLESGWTCELDENMLVAIHTSSSMILPHTSTPPDTNLANFPAPIYQRNAIFKNQVTVVIPDNPTAAELRSAMTIAAALSNISSRRLIMELNTVGQLTSEQKSKNNLVLIGKAATLAVSKEFNFPLPLNNGNFLIPEGNPDDGVVQLINSPWSEDKVVLVVSGNTDTATVKAAQAVSTNVLRSNMYPNVAIVDTVKTAPVPLSLRVNQTLDDMGYGGRVLREIGTNYVGYEFYIPPGQTITEEAYFELQFGHSSLLQYDRSGIVVSVNGKPVGSVPLTAETSQRADNVFRFSIPPSAVLTGNNYLELRVSLIPVDRCTDPGLAAVYANIWPESNLHLPLVQAVISPTANYDLTSYPAPFAYDSTLNLTAFVLQRGDIDSWREAFLVAGYLGDSSNGPVTTLSVFYADELPEAERSKYNFIIVGRPSQLPILSEINDLLPAPFDFVQDVAREPSMQVKYRINPKAAIGYVETLSSPWNADKIILMAVGNSAQSVKWAASHLTEPLSYKLAGNFAVINDKRVYTANTKMTTITPGIGATQDPVVEVVPPVVDMAASPPYRPAWILPALTVSIVLILFTLIVAIAINWSRNRTGKKPVVSDQKQE